MNTLKSLNTAAKVECLELCNDFNQSHSFKAALSKKQMFLTLKIPAHVYLTRVLTC